MVAGGVAVIVVPVIAQDRIFVSDLPTQWQLVGNECPWHIGADRLKRPPNLFGRIRLGIPHILVWRAAFEKQKDT